MSTIRVSFDRSGPGRCIRYGSRPWSLCRRRVVRWLPPVEVEVPPSLENVCQECQEVLLEYVTDPAHFTA